MSGWVEVARGYWRREVPGGWLGVKRDGARWMWVHYFDGYDRGPSALCYGRESAEAAMAHADASLGVAALAARGRARYGNTQL